MPIRAQTGYQPVADPMTCEICGASVALADTHSISICYNMPGAGYGSYQCSCEQHFACSHEHAMLAAMACLFSHIEVGQHAQPVAALNIYNDADLNTIASAITKYES